MDIPAELGRARLEVFATVWCPDCRRLKQFLQENAVAFTEVDIDRTPGAAERLMRETGKRAIPFVLVNGTRWVKGYDVEAPNRLKPERLLQELAAAAR
jgi:glutaredoxin